MVPSTLTSKLVDELRRQIAAGDFPAGGQLPSERQLADAHNVSRGVARAALSTLVTAGLVVGQPQVGYFVRADKVLDWSPDTFEARKTRRDRAGGVDDAWAAEVRAQGYEPRQDVEVQVLVAPAFIAERLDLVDGTDVVVRYRNRYIDGVPYQLADSYYPVDVAQNTLIMAPRDVFVPGGLMAHAGHAHHGVFSDEITVRPPSEEEADRLEMAVGERVIQHVRSGVNAEGRRVRVIVTVLRADRHRVRYQVPAE